MPSGYGRWTGSNDGGGYWLPAALAVLVMISYAVLAVVKMLEPYLWMAFWISVAAGLSALGWVAWRVWPRGTLKVATVRRTANQQLTERKLAAIEAARPVLTGVVVKDGERAPAESA